MTQLLLRGNILGLILVGSAAFAQSDPTWYAGIGIGQTNLKTTSGIVLPSDPPQFDVIDESDDLTKVFLGWKPVRFFAVEVSAFAGGDFTETLGESSPGAGDGFEAAIDSSGYDASILGILPLADRSFELFGRLGVQRSEFRVAVRDQTDTDFSDNFKESIKQTNRLYGIGAQFNFGDRKRYGLRLEGNIIDPKDNIDEISEVLLSFNFGWGGNN